ncbi:MAG TPA: maleylpyruvate isomerase family mycothiol-dependent enzyme [Acidimicrobiia bacterium]|nr:maleylpyruvate isomerase family mycothiol-dependent enzyme [Acidimicrobiia bacterium]
MSEWHFMDPSSRANLVEAWQREAEGMFSLAADPTTWEAPTGAGHWEVRDVLGHLTDTTEAYFASFDGARGKTEAPAALGVRDMARHVDEGARSMRSVAHQQLVERLRGDFQRMLGIAAELTDDEWAGLMVPHKFMGPLPAAFYPLFQLVDYGLHSWDIRQGTGQGHALDGDTADLLVPLAFILWQSTPEVPADTEPYTLGVTVSGRNAGKWRVSVSPAGVQVEEGDVDDLPAVIEFDPASLILTAYGRMNAGTVRGDRQLAERYLNSFFRI